MKTLQMLSLCFLLLGTMSCQKDEETPPLSDPPAQEEQPDVPKPVENPQAPLIYARFLQQYQSGHYIQSVTTDTDSTRVLFSDNSQIAVHTQNGHVVQIEKDGKPTFSKNSAKKTWSISEVPTNIPYKKSTSLQNRAIVSLYYNATDLYLFLDNGFEMHYYIGAGEEGILELKLDPILNPVLETPLSPESSGDYLIFRQPNRYLNNKWIATVSYRGKSLKVNGVEQKNGESVHNFNQTVEYTLEKSDGTILTYNVLLTFSQLPRVSVKTHTGLPITSKEEYVDADILIEDPYALYSDGKKIACVTEIRGRGNATWGWAKKPYKIKLEKKKALLGMTKDKQWALIANHVDKSLMRNTVAFAISEMTGLMFTPDSRYVDLFVNNTYQGLYCLTEQIRVSDERVQIALTEETGDITGGYFLELDNRLDGERYFRTTRKKVGIVFKEPKVPTDPQFNYVRDYFEQIESVIYGDNYQDPEEGYAKYIDVESFADNYIIQELTKNADGYMILSSYFVKPKDGKLAHSNVWDFDLSLGNCSYISHSATDWYINHERSAWYDRILQDPAFRKIVKTRWNRIRSQVEQLPGRIDEIARLIDDSQRQNFKLWQTLGKNTEGLNVRTPDTYQGEVDYLKEFLIKRTAWFNTEVNKW